MLTQGEDVEVHALRERGWSISAIARHLERDPKTIRAYLNGERVPGRRMSSATDPLSSFEAYVRARFVDAIVRSPLRARRVRLGAAGQRCRARRCGDLWLCPTHLSVLHASGTARRGSMRSRGENASAPRHLGCLLYTSDAADD